jgi:OOP family OmpA-OmpF porin
MKKTTLALCLALGGVNAAHANEGQGLELFLGVDKTNWFDSRGVEDATGVDLGAAYNLNENWAIETWYARADSEALDGSDDILVETASLNGLRYLAGGDTRPFFTFGASKLMLNPDLSASSDDTTFDLGVGLKHYFNNRMIARGDLIAHIFDDEGDREIDSTIRVSLGYSFGKKAKKAYKPTPLPAPAAPVEEPVDSDGDGVIDSADKCPNTEANIKVDAEGCAIVLTESVQIELNIQFPNNSDAISNDYLNEIENVAKFMNQYSGTVVEIHGFTDDRGSASYNQGLSERRAKAVAAKLVSEFDIDSSRVNAIGFGEENPIADNNTAEGRAQNRRVVAEISAEVEKTVSK